MRFLTACRHVVVMLATVGLIVPQIAFAGNGPQDTAQPRNAAVQDVALNPGGQLSGQLLDSNGSPVIGSKIQLLQNGKTVATATTNRSGQFAVDGLHAGIYQINSNQTAGIYRVWTAEGAPPVADSRVLLCEDGRVVRAQRGNVKNMLLIGGLIVTAGVIGGVIGYNIRDVDDAS